MNEEHPITYIVSYRGVRGFGSNKLHVGKRRDVLINGEIPSGKDFNYTVDPDPVDVMGSVENPRPVYQRARRVSGESAEKNLEGTADSAKEFASRIDKTYIYLGASQGARVAVKYIDRLGELLEKEDITLVACDCNWGRKRKLAEEKGCPIIQSDCGGKETLRRIVENELL